MGGAIQALWCLEGGKAIEAFTEAHVGLEGNLINPDPASAAAYDKAYGEYSRYLGALSPLYK
jgi:xylulokinase